MALPQTKTEYLLEFLRQREIKGAVRPILISYDSRKYGQDIKAEEKLPYTCLLNTSLWVYHEPFLLIRAMLETGALTNENLLEFKDPKRRYFGFTALSPLGYSTKATFHEKLVLSTADAKFWQYVDIITSKAVPPSLTSQKEIDDMSTPVAGKGLFGGLFG